MKINYWKLLSLVLTLLKQLAESTPSDADDLTVAAVNGALVELERVRGSDVFMAQLEELRTEKLW